MMPAALDAAARALAIDPESAEAHNALACAALVWQRDFTKAGGEFLEALALNPKYIQARCWYGLVFLQWAVARHDEGLAQVWQALEADPLSSYASTVVSLALGTVGRVEEALAYAQTAVEQDPQSFLGRWTLAFAYHWNGKYDESLAVQEALWVESPNNWVAFTIVSAYAKVGRLEHARKIYDELVARRAHEYVPPFTLAVCANALGDHEAAMAFCEDAVEGRDVLLGFFHAWVPGFEPLRSDPRFAHLVERFNARMRSS
jgi:pentatricopeptide repeat protein